MSDQDQYRYRGARALVLLHERYLREFVETWREARAAGISLPASENRSYASMGRLLAHVLWCARSYMIWICENLELPDPEFKDFPPVEAIEAEAEAYLEHILERWRLPLVGLTEEDSDQTFPSEWDIEYSIDAMLEHAVLHPIRHTFQLRELMA